MTAVNKPVVVSEILGSRVRLGQRLVERIGNTPLLRMERLTSAHPNVEIYAKAEWFNPGGSVKYRAA
jgi:cysteine synthase B